MDDASDEQTKTNWNEAEPHDQPERVGDSTQQIRYREDSQVILESYPLHWADTIPLIERVKDGQQKGNKNEESVY
jgi:hypothetical protein